MKRPKNMKRPGIIMNTYKIAAVLFVVLGLCSFSFAIETGQYRLLSISTTEKLIVVSSIPDKTKYILDVASAKITVNGEPAEFKELKSFSIIQIKLELKEDKRKGVDIDGSALEIRISDPDKISQKTP